MLKNETVLYQKKGRVGIITLNRPERLNAINTDLLDNLIGKLTLAGRDDEIASVILTGAGRAFCAGEDLKETAGGKTFEQWLNEVDGLQDVQRVILMLGKPLIAAIPGYAVGGGLEFALSCDIRIAAEDAQFGFPETSVGLTVTTAGTKLISQVVGLGKAKELIFTGEIINTQEALRIGLINRVVPSVSLFDEAMALCDTINRKSSLALKLSRIAIDQGLHSSFEQILALEASHLLSCINSKQQADYVNRKLARMEKKS
jgi:enoyl-CoA hydratase